MKAIIGGTGVYDIAHEGFSLSEECVQTPYGEVTVDIASSDRGVKVAFLARHGKGHGVPPHLINYRANMMALKKLGVNEIFATCAVGSIKPEFAIGDIVIIRDFMDFTKSRISTYLDGSDGKVGHAVMSKPYCPSLIRAFEREAKKHDIRIKGNVVYVCTEGPRFETAAEIRMYEKLGGDVVGMTNVPESVLAKELGICYAAVGMISNMCTGVGKDMQEHDFTGSLAENKIKLTEAFISALLDRDDRAECRCKDSIVFL